MRFAFLSQEFPTNSPSSGGLASFLGRMTRSLQEQGHNVDVFLPNETNATEQWHGVRVMNVPIPMLPTDLWNRGPGRWWGRISFNELRQTLHTANCLANAMEAQHVDKPYDVVHGADFGLTSFFVQKVANRTSVVRASSRSELCRKFWGASYRLEHYLLTRAEHRSFRNADLTYAPSESTSRFYSSRADVEMKVIRPPFDVTHRSSSSVPDLPERFLLHFGNINRVKGSDWLANALLRAWKSQPDLQMVWAGRDDQGWVPQFQQQWGMHSANVCWLGALPREQMLSVVEHAIAVVAPSRVDNLPNTVLEAQAMGVPVVGSIGSSIDEIVVDAVSGKLVEIDDEEGLADTLVLAWNQAAPFDSKCSVPPIFEHMNPDVAIDNLLAFLENGKSSMETQS